MKTCVEPVCVILEHETGPDCRVNSGFEVYFSASALFDKSTNSRQSGRSDFSRNGQTPGHYILIASV